MLDKVWYKGQWIEKGVIMEKLRAKLKRNQDAVNGAVEKMFRT